MKNYTKIELLSLIKESLDQDLPEMAQPESAKYRPISLYENQIHVGWKKELTVPGQRQKFKDGVVHVGWMLADKNPILFNPDKDVNEFVNENQDIIEMLANQYGKENIKWVQEKNPKWQPFRGKNDTPNFKSLPGVEGGEDDVKYGYDSGEQMSLNEKINRILKDVLYDEFEEETEQGKQFQEILNRRSIPTIHPRYREFVDEDLLLKNNNELVKFRCLSYNSYKSKEDFLELVFNRITGEFGTEEERERMKTHALARQFNQKYQNWEEDRKNSKMYMGKTEIYNLDKRGYEALNLDVSLRMDFEVTGQKQGNNFVWTISMVNKFGQKLPTDASIRERYKEVTYKVSFNSGSILDEKVISTSVSVDITGESYDENRHILDVKTQNPIYDGLVKAIDDFKSKVESIKPKEALKLASIEERDIQKSNLNERETIKLVKSFLKK